MLCSEESNRNIVSILRFLNSNVPISFTPRETMKTFQVALAGLDGQVIPDWVPKRLAEEKIAFVAKECHTREELAEFAADADVVWLFGGSKILHGNLDVLPRCGAIIRTGSGTDNVPVKDATRLHMVVANTPESLNDAVAEHAIGLMLAVIRQIALQDRKVRSGLWDRYEGFPRWHLHGQTLGLVGFGRIARSVAKRMRGFEMNMIAFDPYVSAAVFAEYSVKQVKLEDLLASSDFVSLHCPLTEATRHLIREPQLKLMKPTSVLVNTSRGPVVDEAALISALTQGWISAAGLDVLDPEPPAPNNPLLKMENVVITPHLSGFSDLFLPENWRLSVESVLDLFHGKWPRSYVNPEVTPRWSLKAR